MGLINLKKVLPIAIIGMLVISGLGVSGVNEIDELEKTTVISEFKTISFSSVSIEEKDENYIELNFEEKMTRAQYRKSLFRGAMVSYLLELRGLSVSTCTLPSSIVLRCQQATKRYDFTGIKKVSTLYVKHYSAIWITKISNEL